MKTNVDPPKFGRGKLKVYGWTAMAPACYADRQLRCIVAAKSFAEAKRLADAHHHNLHRDYCSETGNERELAAAYARPGIVLARGLDDRKSPYEPIRRS